jgi:hypothetical protein
MSDFGVSPPEEKLLTDDSLPQGDDAVKNFSLFSVK